jgi:hypothetical protein
MNIFFEVPGLNVYLQIFFTLLSIGIVGFLGFRNRSVWLPFIITKVALGFGAGFTHILHAVRHNNFSPNNVGVILYWDFIFPTITVALYILYRREQNALPASAAVPAA